MSLQGRCVTEPLDSTREITSVLVRGGGWISFSAIRAWEISPVVSVAAASQLEDTLRLSLNGPSSTFLLSSLF